MCYHAQSLLAHYPLRHISIVEGGAAALDAPVGVASGRNDSTASACTRIAIWNLPKSSPSSSNSQKRGEKLGLAEDKIAFYNALEAGDSAIKVLGDDTLKAIARELVETVRAKLRVMVKRILRHYVYPPEKQEKAAQTVLEQVEVIAADRAGQVE
jgi:hypothetical protein